MRFCQPHWTKLREVIEVKGMSHLVAKSGEMATKRLAAEMVGTATDDTYDPLMAAHWAIVNRCVEVGAHYIMFQREDGSDYCPLCEVVKHTGPGCAPCEHPGEDDHWIDGCTDMIRGECVKKGLVIPS